MQHSCPNKVNSDRALDDFDFFVSLPLLPLFFFSSFFFLSRFSVSGLGIGTGSWDGRRGIWDSRGSDQVAVAVLAGCRIHLDYHNSEVDLEWMYHSPSHLDCDKEGKKRDDPFV